MLGKSIDALPIKEYFNSVYEFKKIEESGSPFYDHITCDHDDHMC